MVIIKRNFAQKGCVVVPVAAPPKPTKVEEFNGNPVIIPNSVRDKQFQGLKVYGKSTQDGTPSPENPVPIVSAGEGGSIELAITGKNLLIENQYQLERYNIYFGRAESYPGFLLKAHTGYTLSAPDFADPPNGIYFNDKKTAVNLAVRFNSRTCSYTPDDDIVVSFDAYWANGRPENVTELQLEIGSSATAYEPPKSPQSLPLSTPSGLPGIPVDSGGNYIDASGQQLTSDYWDFGDGQQHILCGEIASYNGEEITAPYISSTGALTTGAQVLYVLPEPRTEPIPAEIMAAYRALTTYPGTTVVSTAEPVAGIEVKAVVYDAQPVFLSAKSNELFKIQPCSF